MFESCAGGVASNCCIGGGRCRNGLPNAVHRQRIPNGDCSRSSCPCPQSRRRISWQTGPDNDVDVLGEWRSRIFFFLSMFTFFVSFFLKFFRFEWTQPSDTLPLFLFSFYPFSQILGIMDPSSFFCLNSSSLCLENVWFSHVCVRLKALLKECCNQRNSLPWIVQVFILSPAPCLIPYKG